ncbi:hypothetical protein UFOVP1290_211 [uncultured Caudovirales phage]|uniref:Uncharacterized protein n=1 Tax=uncultured Caudovirales phage TaxID=2100421 RepID=A0A6J5RSX2_9CAUD|nr:hypothetical protein UFOVP1290_211 [uncultured Caudovirales phage]
MLERFTRWFNIPGRCRGECLSAESAYEAGWNAAIRFIKSSNEKSN